MDSGTGDFVYVAIPETMPVHRGMENPYRALLPTLTGFSVRLPNHLESQHMHLDPDFEYLTYGDTGQRGKQLESSLQPGDLVCFYAGLRDVRLSKRLVYAILGVFIVAEILSCWVSAHDRQPS